MTTRRRLLMMMGLAGAALGAAPNAIAQDPCSKYYGKGYCTDYVNSKIRKRQRGDAKDWPSNQDKYWAHGGDIAIFRNENHVAYVERVTQRYSDGRTREVEISEWNYGRGWTDRQCLVTSNFGKKTVRKINVTSSQVEFLRV
jgi:hypothetical protein